ncbi:MAG: hypothetical protein ABI443_09980, partial [Chthoniobacterales bacterium]
FFFFPDQAQRMAPRQFGGETFQLVFTAVTAVLASLGLFISLRGTLDSRHAARGIVWPFLGFLLFFGLVFGFFGTRLVHAYAFRGDTSALLSSRALPQLLAKLNATDSPTDRQTIAMSIFQMHGVPVIYEDKKAHYTLYKPSPVDIQEQDKFRVIIKGGTQILTQLNADIHQLQCQIALYSITLFFVFGFGALGASLTNGKSKDTPPAPPHEPSAR